MKVKVYGSGSSGNTYTLTSSTGETLVLDAGVNPKDVFRDVSPENISAVLVTHTHGDHIAYINRYFDCFAPVVAPIDNNKAIMPEVKKRLRFGGFSVTPLEMYHDVPCFGYFITHKEAPKGILYATDTARIKYKFKELSLAMIEADYDKMSIWENCKAGIVPVSVAERTKQTHFSLEKAIWYCKNGIEFPNQIMLVHLSSQNANAGMFRDLFLQEVGIDPYIATKGLEFDIKAFSLFS